MSHRLIHASFFVATVGTVSAAMVIALIVATIALVAAVSLPIPANAAGLISFSELVPAAPAYAIEPVITTGKCDIADAAAHMTHAYPVEWPEVPAAQGVPNASTTVLIDLDSRGTLRKAAVADSSGNALLDDEALLVVRMSGYASEIQNCNRFARSYFINVLFE